MPQKRTLSKPRNAVVVLGMHRSGTSALAGVLARLGCDLPQALMEANASNPKEYYESMKVCGMNDAILTSGGSHWDDWQQFNPDWIRTQRADEFLERGQNVLEAEFGQSRLFTLKDPRICRLMPFWNSLFEDQGIKPIYVHTHRNPVDVAKSLHNRYGLPFAYSMLLWLRHVLDAEQGSRDTNRCFTSYTLLLEGWGNVVANLQSQTGLIFPRLSETADTEIEAFLSVKLRHNVSSMEGFKANPLSSKWACQIFEILERWADTGEDQADFVTFDTVRAEFNVAAPMFGTLVQDARSGREHKESLEASVEKVKSLENSVEAYKKQVEKFVKSEATYRADIAAAQAQAEQEHEVLQSTMQEMRQLREVESERRSADDALSVQRIAVERANAELSVRLTQSTDKQADLEGEIAILDQEKWQIKSELLQRSLEAEDVGRQNAENTAKVDVLAAQIEGLNKDRDVLIAENDQFKKSARLLRVSLQNELEKKLETALSGSRKQADRRLEDIRKQADERMEDMRRALEANNTALLNSISWKITSPLRRFATIFRRRQ